MHSILFECVTPVFFVSLPPGLYISASSLVHLGYIIYRSFPIHDFDVSSQIDRLVPICTDMMYTMYCKSCWVRVGAVRSA